MKRNVIPAIAVVVVVAIIAASAYVLPMEQKAAYATSTTPTPKAVIASVGTKTRNVSSSGSIATVDIIKNASVVKAGEKAFNPDPVKVSAGSTVIWKNSDTTIHTLKSGSGPKDSESGKLFDSGIIKPGTTFTFKFLKAGTYHYYCSQHPAMVGKVVVS